jgi:ABC-type thiamin/hydroxymethylpyrimidine transport system permease subunit
MSGNINPTVRVGDEEIFEMFENILSSPTTNLTGFAKTVTLFLYDVYIISGVYAKWQVFSLLYAI